MIRDATLRRIVLDPDDLVPGLEARLLEDDSIPITRHDFLARFDPLTDLLEPRWASDS